MALLSRILTLLGARDRRRHKRFNFPLPLIIVKIDHKIVRYKAEDWSASGFKLANYPEKLKVGDTLKGEIQFASGPQGTFVAKVAHILPDGSIGTQFIELSPPEFLFPVKE